MTDLVKVNFGCGESKLEGFINIDSQKEAEPDVVCNFKVEQLPFKDGTVDTFYAIHSIEHIEAFFWDILFNEITRVLKLGGELILAYPEFEVILKYWLENYLGLRDFWKHTIYGRQLRPGDYHVTPVITSEMINILKGKGFERITFCPEVPYGDHYTFLRAFKGTPALNKVSATDLSIFGKDFKTTSAKFSQKP